MTVEAAAPDAATKLEPAALAGKTRAELLGMCRARGLAATAWKKERMEQALLAGELPAARVAGVSKPTQSENVLAVQMRMRSAENDGEKAVQRAKASMAARTGACLSMNGCKCEAYEVGERDAFGWQMCQCQHTQWAHAIPHGRCGAEHRMAGDLPACELRLDDEERKAAGR